jgi:hypothetical protein
MFKWLINLSRISTIVKVADIWNSFNEVLPEDEQLILVCNKRMKDGYQLYLDEFDMVHYQTLNLEDMYWVSEKRLLKLLDIKIKEEK